MIYERAIYPVAEYAFKHPLTHEVALGAQLTPARRARHVRVAEAIAAAEPERLDEYAGLLAHHWSEAGDALRASTWHVRAARWVRVNDLAASRRHRTQARRLLVALPDSSERTQLLLDVYPQLIDTLDRLGAEPAEAEAVYAEAIDVTRGVEERDAGPTSTSRCSSVGPFMRPAYPLQVQVPSLPSSTPNHLTGAAPGLH
jgi:predicted ATPase